MTSEAGERVREIFADLLRLRADRRWTAARRACAGDPDVLREVLRLLPHAHDVVSRGHRRFLEPPTMLSSKALRAGPALEMLEGRTIASRYRVGRVIGRGGGGVVFEAEDDASSETVAVKAMRGLGRDEITRIRREVATLRWLHLPGVVRHLDDGTEDGVVYCVMELVRGTPFPGAVPDREWKTLQPVALGLLETLARVHQAGIVHRDLKPANVLVDGKGRVTLLDLGVCGDDASRFSAPQEAAGFTLGYASPEQMAGEPADARSDLYSAGVMICEALAGVRPPRGGLAPGDPHPRVAAPPLVLRWLAGLLQRDRARRPASAAEALATIRPRVRLRRVRDWTEAELRGRFSGFDVIHHVREDGAAELFRRTDGNSAAVERELAAWVRAGLAIEESGRVQIDRVSLERLRHLPPEDGRALPPRRGGRDRWSRAAQRAETRFAEAITGDDPAKISKTARTSARASLEAGHPDRALAAAREGLHASRGRPDVVAERAILTVAAQAALATGSSHRFRELLRWTELGSCNDPVVSRLGSLARGTYLDLRGDPEAALPLLDEVIRSGVDDQVVSMAWSVAVVAARRIAPSLERRWLSRAQRWVKARRDVRIHDMLHAWNAWRHYRAGRFLRAARMHEALAVGAVTRTARSRHLLDACCAALDGLDHARARRLAGAALRSAVAGRNPHHEARARVLLRTIRYRSGRSVPDDPELLEALRALGNQHVLAEALLNEAAVAWRRGCGRDAVRLSGEAAAIWQRLGAEGPAVLARALAAASGEALPAADVARLVARAGAVEQPGLALQAVALLAGAMPDGPPSVVLRRLPRLKLDSRRREVLSTSECRRRLRDLTSRVSARSKRRWRDV